MNIRRTLVRKGTRWVDIVALGFLLMLGAWPVPGARATGNTPSSLAPRPRVTDDNDAWSALSTGVNGEVFAIAISGEDVYVGGYFNSAGDCTTDCNNIAKWNITSNTWSSLGTGVDGEVFAIAISGNQVYVGGSFAHAGGMSASNIAVWNGAWSALGTVTTNGAVRAIAVSGGDVYAGGEFTQIGTCTSATLGCYFVSVYIGGGWGGLASGTDSYVYALADGVTKVYAGGIFPSASGVTDTTGIAYWNEPGWNALGTGVSGIAGYSVNAIAVSGSDVYAGGVFDSTGGVPATNIAKWNSESGWSALAPGIGDNGAVNAIAVSGGNVFAGGDFQANDNGAPNHIAEWNSTSGWSALGEGTDGKVYAIAIKGFDVYVGGSFSKAGSCTTGCYSIAKYRLPSINVYLPLIIRR